MRRSNKRGPGNAQGGGVQRAAYRRDVAWDAQPAQPAWQPAQAAPPVDSQPDPWQAPYVQPSQDWAFEAFHSQPEQAHNTCPNEQGQMAWPEDLPAKPKPRGRGLSALLIIGALAIIVVCGLSVYQAYQRHPGFLAKLNAMRGHTFASGVHIDNQPVGGLTPGELQSMGSSGPGGQTPQTNIRLVIDDTAFQLNSNHIPFERNIAQVAEQAWAVSRQTFAPVLGSGLTPFELRYRHKARVAQEPAYFYTQISYNGLQVEALARSLAEQISKPAINAVVSSFDFNTRQFAVTQDVKGRQMDTGLIATALRQALDRGDYAAEIRLASQTILPRVSSVDLHNSFTKLASFTTKTTSDADRNNNIALAAQAISNTTLMPGETFSFNETTGQRTIQKGYRGAPAISGGVLIDDVGGGVCQVSSTLFYAAASAGLHIVERSPHAWPVSYMDKGLDATVNWPNLDFKFKNDKDTPVFIIASYQNRSLTVEFYGMLSAPGEGIRLEAQLMSSSKPPREPVMQHNPSLPPGSQKELKQARTGYVVDTYRIYLRNGAEVRREKLFTSKYREVQQVIEYN